MTGEHPGDHLRISDAERERAAAELAEHYAQGRLTADEHAERLDRIWAAKTRGELGPVFADLPGPARPAPAYAVPPGRAGSRGPARTGRLLRALPTPIVVLLVVLAGVAVLAHLPLIVVGLLAWGLLMRKGPCVGRPHRAHWS